MSDPLVYDSRSVRFKSPYGAVPSGTQVTFTLRPLRSEGYSRGKLTARLEQRAATYNVGIALAKQYEKQGKLLIVAPDDTCGMDTLTRNPEAMKRFYEKGFQDGGKIADFLD